MRSKSRTMIGAAILIAGAVVILLSGMRNSSQYFQTVSEFKAEEADLVDRGLRINGYVDSSSISWNADSLLLEFRLTDGEAVIPVRYRGVAPDLFGAGQSIVVEGKLDRNGVFNATNILVKCPSKYEPEEPQQTDTPTGT